MMISSKMYIENLKGKNYKDLLIEKNKLVEYITNFEEGKIDYKEICHPLPNARYQMYLEYLSVQYSQYLRHDF